MSITEMSASSVTSSSKARDYLKGLREKPRRESQHVVDVWRKYFAHNPGSLKEEQYNVLEQVFFAALDCREFALAEECFQSLHALNPKSVRIERLRGMHMEAMGKYDAAQQIYTSLIEEDETESVSRKRLVALKKAQNKYAEAIVLLQEYLKIFQIDKEAWLELCDLYCMQQDFVKAAFCAEELILLNPYNHLHYQRYAELKYADGQTAENLDLAKSYFAQAVRLSHNYNWQSVYGLAMASALLATSTKLSLIKRAENAEIALSSIKVMNDLHKKHLNATQMQALQELRAILSEFVRILC